MARSDLTVTALVNPVVLEHDPEDGCDECLLHCVALAECWADMARRVATDIEPPAPSDCPLRSRPIIICRPGACDPEP